MIANEVDNEPRSLVPQLVVACEDLEADHRECETFAGVERICR
ncbi:hypothetical protein KOR42_46380 [Thalassoglobus neptunius]|uniref:Uncharacterized protein n=1 Tax=Thalassoglobus neptunius TaxID=1938619 RepID=A0A5C5VXY4_9PLAN|nr:hypothetical protein KOR42_46380 [Thalassoglobus neptunius]